MADKFYDFDLGIWKEGDVYKAEVRGSPAGTCPRTAFDWPFSDDHQDLLRELELAVMRAHGYRGPLMSPDEAKLRDFGAAVFDAVFRGAPAIQDRYTESLRTARKDGCALRLKLRVDPPELAVLPWEYVYDKVRSKDFVCLDESQPLVRFFDQEDAPALPDDRALRVLGIVANQRGDLDAEKERHRLNKVFANAVQEGHELRWVPGHTTDALKESLRDGPWDVFHFIGHGGTDIVKDHHGQLHTVGYVLMQGRDGTEEKVYPSELSRMLRMGNVRLAVLNCCDSGRGSVSALGATLVQAAVLLAVAMQFPISDDAALEFSDGFYRALLKGFSVERSLALARTAMRASSTLEWGIPVLFTRVEPTVIFRPAGAAAASKVLTVRSPAPPPVAADPPVLPAASLAALTDAQEEFRRLWRQ